MGRSESARTPSIEATTMCRGIGRWCGVTAFLALSAQASAQGLPPAAPKGFDTPKDQAGAQDPRNLPAMEDELTKDVIPFVEGRYPVLADRDHRAVTGLSMGGAQALHIGLRHRDQFAWVGGFAASGRLTQADFKQYANPDRKSTR